ncbi:MAG: DUF6498-containing protein [Propionibacteriales bacterium]|nr:DUF6498-containing protein [Propionibacteriales bacterium]
MVTNRWGSVLLGLATNVVTLLGVLVWGWPAANVFLLFLGENLILGLVTLIRMLSLPRPSIGLAAFFCLHYGVFSLIQGIFVAQLIGGLNPVFDFWWLGLPMIMIGIRYAIELITVWFLGGGRATGLSPQQVMMSPYPRVIVLHFAVLMALFGGGSNPMFSPIIRGIGGLLNSFGLDLGPGGNLVLLLVLIKTVVDVKTTRSQLERESRPQQEITLPPAPKVNYPARSN